MLLMAATSAFAQNPDEPLPRTTLRFGPLTVNPTIALTNAGVDANVFNSTQPQSDFTMTVTPATDLSMRLGRSRLTGTVKQDLVYFHRFAGERSANTSYRGAVAVPFNRVTVKASASRLNIRDRPGYEIDTRSQRAESSLVGAVDVRVFGKTSVTMTGSRSSVRFDSNILFFGSSLAEELNRTTTTASISVKHQLTPVTGLVFKVDRDHDRFEFAHRRDSNSSRVTAGIQFDPFGLISGTASFGYRRFESLSATTPSYVGAMAAVDLSYRISGSMKLSGRVSRDLQYSYDITQPYYIETGFGGSFERQISGPLDLIGRIGIEHLGYRGQIGQEDSLANRLDTIRSFGGGVGYRIGRGTRIGFNIDKQHRTSNLSGHGYGGLRYGTSVTYGF
jgi:hypothetical protein